VSGPGKQIATITLVSTTITILSDKLDDLRSAQRMSLASIDFVNLSDDLSDLRGMVKWRILQDMQSLHVNAAPIALGAVFEALMKPLRDPF
jgi:hypothetical protein